MRKRIARRYAAGLLAALNAVLPASASAQSFPASMLSAGGTASVDARLDDGLRSRHISKRHLVASERVAVAAVPDAKETPPPPIGDSDAQVIGFPKGLHYAVQLTSAYQMGRTGEPKDSLPGGIDATLVYRIEPRTNLFVDYFQIQVQPLSIDDGFAPVYNEGATRPNGSIPLALIDEGVSTKASALVLGFQRILFIGAGAANHGHPIVIAPAYASVRSDIGGGHLDMQTQYNAGHIERVAQGATQTYVLNVVLPLSLTEKLDVAYFATPVVLVHASGFNQTNHVQYEQQLLVLYNPTNRTSFYAVPSRGVSYFPTATYPIHTTNLVLGAQRKLAQPGGSIVPFIKAELLYSNPDNSPGLGITRITDVPGIGIIPAIGGVKFTTVRLAIGVGNAVAPIIPPYP